MDEMVRRLIEWVRGVVGDVAVAPFTRGSQLAPEGIGLLLLDVHRSAVPRGTRRSPSALTARFLLTVEHEDPLEAFRLVGELAFAAVEDTALELELEPVPSHIWGTLDLHARPALLLRLPVRRVRPERIAPRVREPLVMEGGPVTSLEGRVLGPGDHPIPYARVHVPGLGVSAYADTAGRFRVAAVPLDPPLREVVVSAKGIRTTVVADEPGGFPNPLIIRLSEAEV